MRFCTACRTTIPALAYQNVTLIYVFVEYGNFWQPGEKPSFLLSHCKDFVNRPCPLLAPDLRTGPGVSGINGFAQTVWASRLIWPFCLLLAACSSWQSKPSAAVGQESAKPANPGTHYFSGEVVSVDPAGETVRVQETVDLTGREIKAFLLGDSTNVIRDGERIPLDEIRPGDFVMITYSEEREKKLSAEEIRLASKPGSVTPRGAPETPESN